MRALLVAAFCTLSLPASAQDCRTDFAPGLEQSSVRDIQAQLEAHGFKPGVPDGVLGRRTCAAVRAYQKAAGLPVDGVLDLKLQNHLRFIARKDGDDRR